MGYVMYMKRVTDIGGIFFKSRIPQKRKLGMINTWVLSPVNMKVVLDGVPRKIPMKLASLHGVFLKMIQCNNAAMC